MNTNNTPKLDSYNNLWPQHFEKYSFAIQKVFNGQCLGIFHVGSTAVEGMEARPVIDMIAIVSEIREIDEYIPHLEALGYIQSSISIVNGITFINESSSPYAILYVYQKGSALINQIRMFDQYLRQNESAKTQYRKVKKGLSPRKDAKLTSWSANRFPARV